MNQILIYRSEDGRTKLDVRLEDRNIWLNQKQLAELFGKAKGTISEHIKHIFEDEELNWRQLFGFSEQFQKEGDREVVREVEFYNLDMVLALGFRVRSPVAVRFRQWAADKLKEYIIKGFVLDDERLKNPKVGNDYFEESHPAHPGHPHQRAAVLPENHRHLRHEHRLRQGPPAHPGVLRHGAEQGALRHSRPDRRRSDLVPR